MKLLSPAKREVLERRAFAMEPDEAYCRMLVLGAGAVASVPLGVRIVGFALGGVFVAELVRYVRSQLALGALISDERKWTIYQSLPDGREGLSDP